MTCHSYELGAPCPNPARPGSPHCLAHDPLPTPNPRVPAALSVQPAELSEPCPTGPVDHPRSCYDPANRPCEGLGKCAFCGARPNRCHATAKRTGEPCFFPARFEHLYCINHDPEYQDYQRRNSSIGGHNSASARQSLSVHNLNVWIGDRAGIQAALDTVIRLELLGRISPTRSRNILRALAIATRNFEDPGRPRTPHDAVGYGEFREIIDIDLDLALDEARAHDTPPPRRVALNDILSTLK